MEIRPRTTSRTKRSDTMQQLLSLVDRYGEADAMLKEATAEKEQIKAEIQLNPIISKLGPDEGIRLNGSKHTLDISVQQIKSEAHTVEAYEALPLEVFLSICSIPVTALKTVLKNDPNKLKSLVYERMTTTRTFKVLK